MTLPLEFAARNTPIPQHVLFTTERMVPCSTKKLQINVKKCRVNNQWLYTALSEVRHENRPTPAVREKRRISFAGNALQSIPVRTFVTFRYTVHSA